MTLDEKIAAQKTAQETRAKTEERLSHVTAELFASDGGRELLTHLAKRYDILGRTFIANDRGEINALKAAIRDGERAVVNHLLQMIRVGDPKYPFPL